VGGEFRPVLEDLAQSRSEAQVACRAQADDAVLMFKTLVLSAL